MIWAGKRIPNMTAYRIKRQYGSGDYILVFNDELFRSGSKCYRGCVYNVGMINREDGPSVGLCYGEVDMDLLRERYVPIAYKQIPPGWQKAFSKYVIR